MKPPARSATHSSRIAFATLLALALLLAQWTGLAHRVSHAYLQQALIHDNASATHGDHGDERHSCLAFDAATVADTLHVGPYAAPLLTSARVLASWVAFASWNAPLIPYFSSRAPPLA